MIKPTTAMPELAVVSSSAGENDSALPCKPSARLAVLGTNDTLTQAKTATALRAKTKTVPRVPRARGDCDEQMPGKALGRVLDNKNSAFRTRKREIRMLVLVEKSSSTAT